MKKSLLFVLAVLITTAAFAQSRVTGKVTSSEDGSPLPFVTILIQGERGLGTNTDIDGNFVIERCPSDAILVLSYVGFTTIQVPVEGRSVLNITMNPDALALEEVMVVAYGTARKGTYTGAASVVKSDAIKDVPTLSFENALNGKVAGMQITTNSGQAGAVSSIRVRGIGSMNASNEPLYVIDGVPVVSGDTGQMSGYIYATNNVMSTLNPQDIESITVLKDAAASALYGSRAANGVILVTTKTGRLGRPVVNFKASVGLTPSFATVNFDIASPEQQVELYYENFWNAGKYDGKSDEASSKSALSQLNKRFNKHGYYFTADDNTVNSLKILGMTDGQENREGKYYNWDDVLFRTAIYQTY
ncbi:MAG: TonB-dependent receptor plug domain-containing protein, partial [Bacteroidales bacterium]|nr:TonB-dependent receptor plug domain-containing protein [Bacteroidales bacterium]